MLFTPKLGVLVNVNRYDFFLISAISGEVIDGEGIKLG